MADLMKLAAENKCSSLEKPKDIYLHPEEFSIDNNILTPTFKLKRNVASKFFEDQIKAMYANIEAAEAARSSRA